MLPKPGGAPEASDRQASNRRITCLTFVGHGANLTGKGFLESTDMDIEEKFQTIENRYARVLELTRHQLELIEKGSFEALGNVLQEKASQIEAAGKVMAELKTLAGGQEREAIKAGMVRLGAIIDQVMEIENRCQGKVAMPTSPAVPRAAAANMYRRNVR